MEKKKDSKIYGNPWPKLCLCILVLQGTVLDDRDVDIVHDLAHTPGGKA